MVATPSVECGPTELPLSGRTGRSQLPKLPGHSSFCSGVDGLIEQADSYVRALREGKTFRIDGDRLEILDEADEVRLVLVRKTPLPGNPVDLVGTSWRVAEEEEGSSVARAPALAFLSDYIAAGVTACRAYVAHFRVDDERLSFPAKSMTGTTKGCDEELWELEGSYTDLLSLSDDYSVEETTSGKLLRIRTRNGKVLVYEPLPPALGSIAERIWSLTTFVEPRDTKTGRTPHSRTTDVIPGTEVTIELREDGVFRFGRLQ